MIELPEPFDAPDVEVGAWVEYGNRKVCLTLKTPGMIHRNRFDIAWIDVMERQPWRGEPLWVSATRREPGDTSARCSFTDKGRRALELDLLPVVARYGFDRWWTEVHRATKGDHLVSTSERAAVDAREVVRYHERSGELGRLWADGLLEVIVVRPDDLVDCREVKVEEMEHDGRWTRSVAVGRLVFDGDHLGWMTREGRLIPAGFHR